MAEFLNHCGLETWNKNSICRRAVSATPTGPFAAKKGTGATAPRPRTTPTHARTSSCTTARARAARCAPPTNAATARPSPPRRAVPGPGPWPVARARGRGRARAARRSGPGGPAGAIMNATSLNGTWSDTASPSWWNPAPWIAKNGSVTVVCASDYMHVATAPGWRGPHTQGSRGLFSVKNEDAFLWQDLRGNFHLLMHGMQPYGPFGRHACSRTGAAGSWTFSPTKAYDNRIQYQDGSVHEARAAARPVRRGRQPDASVHVGAGQVGQRQRAQRPRPHARPGDQDGDLKGDVAARQRSERGGGGCASARGCVCVSGRCLVGHQAQVGATPTRPSLRCRSKTAPHLFIYFLYLA